MSWLIILIWIAVGAVVVVFGARFTIHFVESRATENERRKVETQSPLPTPTQSLNPDQDLTTASNTDEQIKDKVLKKEYESINIGGAVVLLQTAPNASNEEVALIFSQIKDKIALVNLALNGTVKIENVRLITINPKPPHRKFEVWVTVRNQTHRAVKVKIPKGQIFENKNSITRRQNLAAAGEDIIRIPASSDSSPSTVVIKIEALCINKGFDPPAGDLGNITIFELSNNRFITQDELWDWLADKIDPPDSKHLLHR